MKKMKRSILTLALMLSGTVCPSQVPSTEATEETAKHIIPPEKFSGPAYITEKAGSLIQYGTIPTLYAMMAKNKISRGATPPMLLAVSLAASPAAVGIGSYLLGYPESRWNIIDKPPEEETNLAWACRKIHNATAHTGNQALKIGTVALPLAVTAEIILFKETYGSKSPIVRAIFSNI